MREITENTVGVCKIYDDLYTAEFKPRCSFMVNTCSSMISDWCANAGCKHYGKTCPMAVKQTTEENDGKLSFFCYKDTSVGVSRYNIGNLPKELRRTCFCCGNEMNDCDVVLLINNQAHIQNTLLHADCFAGWANKPDVLCKDIEDAYEGYLKLKAVFGK